MARGSIKFAVTAALSGDLVLDAGGDPNAVFIFQIGSTLTTGANSTVSLVNRAQACRVVWQVGSSATIGAATTFVGNVLAFTSITVVAGTTVDGSMLAKGGAVTLDTNVFTRSACAAGTLSITNPAAFDFAEDGHRCRPDDDGRPGSLLGQGRDGHRRRLARHRPGHAPSPVSPTTSVPSSLAMSTALGDGQRHRVTPCPTVVTGPYTIDNGAVQIASAALNQGMATY